MKNISPHEAKDLIKQIPENLVIIDVRTPAEHQDGNIENSINIDYYSPSFATKVKELDPSKTYLIYCKTGGRSERSCTLMQELGFLSLYNLVGGFTNWQLQS